MSGLFFSLPKGLGLGRQEVHAVAEQRKHEIARFLESLFSLNISISQSDLVYTFFHPLLRDQQDADIHLRKFKGKYANFPGTDQLLVTYTNWALCNPKSLSYSFVSILSNNLE